MLELSVEEGRIVDIDSSVRLPAYTALLRTLFVGRLLDEVMAVGDVLASRLIGPLLKPTIAALQNAATNGAAGWTAAHARSTAVTGGRNAAGFEAGRRPGGRRAPIPASPSERRARMRIAP